MCHRPKTEGFRSGTTYLKAMNKKVGLLINFNVERLKNGIERIVL